MSMIHLLILAVHLLATVAKLVRPGGVRAVVAEPRVAYNAGEIFVTKRGG
jgi:hypothetical protein